MLTIVNLSWQTTEVGIQETTVPPYGERGILGYQISDRYVTRPRAQTITNRRLPPPKRKTIEGMAAAVCACVRRAVPADDVVPFL